MLRSIRTNPLEILEVIEIINDSTSKVMSSVRLDNFHENKSQIRRKIFPRFKELSSNCMTRIIHFDCSFLHGFLLKSDLTKFHIAKRRLVGIFRCIIDKRIN